MYSVIAPLPNMNIIKLKGKWDSQNFHLVNKGHLTGEGLCKYWDAVDSGFKFWQTVVLNPAVWSQSA